MKFHGKYHSVIGLHRKLPMTFPMKFPMKIALPGFRIKSHSDWLQIYKTVAWASLMRNRLPRVYRISQRVEDRGTSFTHSTVNKDALSYIY